MLTIIRSQSAIKGLLASIRNRTIKSQRKLFLSRRSSPEGQWFDEQIGAASPYVFGEQMPVGIPYTETYLALRLWEVAPSGARIRHLELSFVPWDNGDPEDPYRFVVDVTVGNHTQWLFSNDGMFVD
jgi:hypothetical protein